MKMDEIRGLPDVELNNEISKLREKLFKFRFNSANEEMQRAGEIRLCRRSIARMKTVMRERALAAQKETASGRST